MKILIVDDNEDSRIILRKTLESERYTIEAATNGEEALNMARKSPPDMIISDILMPVMDGFQFCCKCKTDDGLKDIPFIFHTATYTDEKDEELALQMGADRFIRKPVEPDEFIKVLRNVIRNVEKGKIRPQKSVLEEKEDVLKLYSERLVNKLEKKMLDLERELAGRKQAEEQVQASLQEKEALLSEIHHRVKNNLQVISSLLDLTSIRTQDRKAISLLTDARAKIQTMAIIHSQLYASKRFDKIDMGSHVRDLVKYLSEVYAGGEKITCIVEIPDIYLSITQAIPFALVLNELISNAFKYAFGKDDEGTVEISIHRSDQDKICARIKDNGTSIPEEVDIYKTNTLGLKLVRNIVQKQLHGKLQLKRDKGTEFIIEFKILPEELNYV
ncbi:MAG: response regulator [Syntrophales bacterium]|nr:response regulator [Syntrophales bacterium]